MADYWKSNPRHYCEVCKCWFGENNISVSMHENGRRHKGNVEKMLKDMRNKAAKREKDEVRTSSMLEKIEREALKAYTKDLEVAVGLPMQTSAQDALLRAEIEREQEKEQIRQQLLHHSMELASKTSSAKGQIKGRKQAKETEAVSSDLPPSVPSVPSQEGVIQPTLPSPWQQLVSPEGYPYYYNTQTGASQWEWPSDQNTTHLPSSVDNSTAATPTSYTATPTSYTSTTSPHTSTSKATPTDQSTTCSSIIGQKRSSEDTDSNQRTGLELPPTKLISPYGAWTTVAVRPQETVESEEDGEDEEEAEEEEDEEGQSQDLSDDGGRRKKFQEKTAPIRSSSPSGSPEPQVTAGMFKGFSFKKRSTNNKPQIRQRTSDFS